MNNNILDKDILLLIEPFYGYGELIEKELLRLGAKSVYRKVSEFLPGDLRDRINFHSIVKHILDPRARDRWTRTFIKEIEGRHFDVFFVVENMTFSKYFMTVISEMNPGIRKILFLWDTFRTQQHHYTDYLHLFDKVYTFDRDDAKKYNLNYYPDFYIDVPVVPYYDCKYDISFFASASYRNGTHRINLTSKILDACNQNQWSTYIYLKYYSLKNNKGYVRRLLDFFSKKSKYNDTVRKHINEGFLYTSPVTINECNRVFSESKAILDINHQNRQGMTINAITAIALGKKLITTNRRIKDEDFYDSNNIFIISENNPVLDAKFLLNEPTKIDLTNLRLDNWLKHIINEE